MEQKANEQAKNMGKLISECWANEAFKQRFISDPAKVMKEAGLEVPEGVEFKVVENTDKVNYILLPSRPTELSDEQLDAVAGGKEIMYWDPGEPTWQNSGPAIAWKVIGR